MRFFSKPLTDDGYVERLRKQLGWWRRLRWWLAVLLSSVAVGHGLIFLMASRVLMSTWKEVGLEDALAPYVVGGCAGALLGLGLGCILASVVESLARCVRGFRTERLLLEHYRPNPPEETPEQARERPINGPAAVE